MTFSAILGTGGYLPKTVLSNHDLEKMVDTSHDWIVERTGIHRRHIASADETASSMAAHAARRALEAAQLSSADIDMVIVATSTPDHLFPGSACLLQQHLGIKNQCPAFDLNSAACAGFIYGLSIADQYIRQGTMRHILVVGSEVMSRLVDWKDRATCVLFGDGAGAVILGARPSPGIIATHIHADGAYKDVLYMPNQFSITEEDKSMKMQGNALFRLAVNTLGTLFDETLQKNNLTKADIDWLIPHQANIRIIQAMAKKLDLDMDHVALTLQEQGNTSAASIPLALDAAVRDGRVQRGDTLLLEGFGGGLVWGSVLVQY